MIFAYIRVFIRKKRMIRLYRGVVLFTGLFLVSLASVSCKDKVAQPEVVETGEVDFSAIEETPVSGEVTFLVEESVYPIVADVHQLFEHEYKRARIHLNKKTEQEIISLLLNDSMRLAILPRMLSDEELKHLDGRVVPKQTHFATDAIVFVTNKAFNDSIVDYDKVLKNLSKTKAMEGDLKMEGVHKEPILVFDQYNSSISAAFRKATESNSFPKDYAYFLKSTDEVIDYVSKTKNAIGVIGLNWLVQPTDSMKDILSDLKVLGVKNPKDGKYYKATQNNIAEGSYPLTRKIYVLDLQGRNGLGLGFASYIAGYKGQRIVLKSGLVPFNTPPREIVVRQEIE